HDVDMHQLAKSPEQRSPDYEPTEHSIALELSEDELRHYLRYCAELLALLAKVGALFAEHSSDPVVLETVAALEYLTTDLNAEIWQKVALLPGR
ncbi:MAG: hypothetical protein ACT4PP_05845, partial [Sporichthyaceae bacterium]